MKQIYNNTKILFIAFFLVLAFIRVGVGQSVLEQGQWYKIQVENDGLYQLNYQDFVDMGFDMSIINPDQIQIFGNIEGMLPEANNVEVPDSLIENAIYISGADDGSFDPEDYVLFYGKGADSWIFNKALQSFRFISHSYEDYNYYFVGISNKTGKRIGTMNSLNDPPSEVITTFIDHQVHEVDLVNFIKSGRRWFGESFDDSNSSIDLVYHFPNLDTSERVNYGLYVAGRSRVYSSIATTLNDDESENLSLPKLTGSSSYEYAKEAFERSSFRSQTDSLAFNLTYSKPDASSNAWLDYFEVSAFRKLIMNNHQMGFNSNAKPNINKVSKFELSNSTDNITIWDITDPYNIKEISNYNLNTDVLDFSTVANNLQYFIAFDSEEFYKPVMLESIENQNLKELSGFDMVIITVDMFLDEAQRLADFHLAKDNMNVLVTTIDKVYNEFSSGKQDPTAIRNYLRYHYYNAASDDEKPEYLLLFGDASYDYKDILSENTNLVPVYQSKGSLSTTLTFDTDDYFGIMNPSEGDSSKGEIQISIGRFPVHTLEQAQTMVNKTIQYVENSEVQTGDWRNKVCFIADDGDSNLHLINSDKLADTFLIEHPEFNIGKIYLDGYVRQNTANGHRYPDVTEAINASINEGVLFMNYTGHGGHIALTDERVLQIPDILSWRNIDKLSVLIVASCEFGPFDDPHHISAGEHVVLNPLGGGVAIFTTTRLAYASYNFKLNQKFHEIAFSRKENGAHFNLGEIIKYAKNESGNLAKNLNFCLLGDPALKMVYPEFHVETTHINGDKISLGIKDTIKARQTVTVSAKVTDLDHDIIDNYNGDVQVCVYGQPSIYTTLANHNSSYKTDFSVVDVVIYKGQVKAEKGELEFSFVVPSGINPQFGQGKISYYATQLSDDVESNWDANGGYLDFTIGGVDETIEEDINGPEINVFMEDYNFIDGDNTSTDPLMIIDLFDESGINNVQLGFGRDITAKLDGDISFVLNDFYLNDVEDFRKGNIEYPLSKLDYGMHELNVKAWDMFDNVSEKSIKFIVISPDQLSISNLRSEPNPFQEFSKIIFDHNQTDENMLYVSVNIYNMQGQNIYHFNDEVVVLGNSINPIPLDANNMNLKKSGLYTYLLEVKNSQGQTVQQKQKIIVVK